MGDLDHAMQKILKIEAQSLFVGQFWGLAIAGA